MLHKGVTTTENAYIVILWNKSDTRGNHTVYIRRYHAGILVFWIRAL
jgi:hypothetical protein